LSTANFSIRGSHNSTLRFFMYLSRFKLAARVKVTVLLEFEA
jgi:hypothetical protein